MVKPAPTTWADTRRQFIEAGGHTTQALGLSRLGGQIYALLYLNPEPMCLDAMAEALGVSKASICLTIRQLEGLLAVKKIWVKGDRKDYYEAETDFGRLVREGLLGVVKKKMSTADVQFDRLESSLSTGLKNSDAKDREQLEVLAKRIKAAKKFHGKLSALLNTLSLIT